MMRQIAVALAFLIRIPVPVSGTIDTRAIGQSMGWFPAVGLVIGSLLALISLIAYPRLPASVVAALLVALDAAVTGALHLDGLADAADGLGGGRTRADALRIMRDHSVGAFGVAAVVVVLVLKCSCLTELLVRGQATGALLVMPALARWSAVVLSAWLPNARSATPEEQTGVGTAARYVTWRELALATAFSALVLPPCGGLRRTAVCWLATLVTTCAAAGISWRKLGGVTGDILGGTVEITSVAQLMAALLAG